jgi:hypothetical protein
MKKKVLDQLIYDCKYTLGSYADAIMSVPIRTSECICKGAEKIFAEKTPRFFKWNLIKEESPTYKLRKNLRKKLDTEPGVKFIQSNLIGAIPFIFIGMPVAELARDLTEKYAPNIGELEKCIANSLCTISSQIVMGYTIFMGNEIRTNRKKYQNENGKLSIKKISAGLKKTIKTFLKFDIAYFVGKTGLQTNFLMNGEDPWKASGIADVFATPIFYALSVPLGLHNGIIETKRKN